MLQDGDTITLGDVTLTAISCPGHCYGATTFTMNVTEGGKSYLVVFPDGSSVNPVYRVAVHPSYPGIDNDYRRTLRILELLKPDIWLAPHNEFFGFAGKRARAATEGVQAWVDPKDIGYSWPKNARSSKLESIGRCEPWPTTK